MHPEPLKSHSIETGPLIPGRIHSLVLLLLTAEIMGKQSKIKDEFRGDDAHLCQSIKALIELSDDGILSTQLGGHARNLLAASYHRLSPKRVKVNRVRVPDDEIGENSRGECD